MRILFNKEELNSINDYPIMKIGYVCNKKTANPDLFFDINLVLPCTGGYGRFYTRGKMMINGEKATMLLNLSDPSILTGGGNNYGSNTGCGREDVDYTKPISELWLKPWHNSAMTTEDTFDIRYISFFKTEDEANAIDTPFAPNGDVMIEIPKMGYRFNRVGNNIHVSVTRDPEAPEFSYDAFVRGDKLNDYIYISAFLSSEKNSFYRSLSNNTPSNSWITLTEDGAVIHRNMQAFKKNYTPLMYYPYVLISCLYLIYNKSIDGRVVLLNKEMLTGELSTSGMNYSDPVSGKNKFIGIELQYSATAIGVYGFYTINSQKNGFVDVYISKNNSIEQYSLINTIPNCHGYKTEIYSNNSLSFLTSKANGTSSTYYKCKVGNIPNATSLPGLIKLDNNSGLLGYNTEAQFAYNFYLMYSAE